MLSKTQKEKEETFDANSELINLIENNGRKTDKRTTGRTNAETDIAKTKPKKFLKGKFRNTARARFLLGNRIIQPES